MSRPGSSHRAAIAPLSQGAPSRRWAVMIPTFNCAMLLRETLAGVLAQDPGPEVMQIEVVDDHSDRDDPEAVVRDIGGRRVGFFRQPVNLGVPGNLNACIARSRGRLVHILHGDDKVLPGFYRAMEQGFESRPDCGAAFCRSVFLSAGGQETVPLPERESPGPLEDALSRLASEQRIMTPSMVVRRSVYETIGGFDERLRCAEDWEMWVRIAAAYPVWYDPSPLTIYRMHGDSNTGRHIATGEDMRFTRRAIDLFSAYLPGGRSNPVIREARRTYAQSALSMAERLRRDRHFMAMGAQIREALLLDASLPTAKRTAGILARAVGWKRP